jgi:anti-sigma factor RsiW
MNCERMEGKLIAYADGHASEAERRVVEAHLNECNVCLARARGFKSVSGLLNELPVHEPSAAFDARLRARLAAEPVRASVWSWLMPAPRLAFAVTLLAMFSVWLSSRPAPMDVHTPAGIVANGSENDFGMIKDLGVLENYDVLSKFDALSQLPAPAADRN